MADRASPSVDQLFATRAETDRLAGQIADLRVAVERLAREHQIEVARAGQLQADMDRIRTAWAMLKGR
jgi:hypothetical protein